MNLRRSLALLAVWLALPANAGTFSTVSWDAVTASNLAGYRVFYGTASGTYTNSVDVGLVTRASLPNVPDATTLYVAVKARTTAGVLSVAFSNEINGWADPTVSPVPPSTSYARGASGSLSLAGTNFRGGMTAALLGETGAYTIPCTVTVQSATAALVAFTVPSSALLGPRVLKLENTDKGMIEMNGVVTIVEAPTQPAPPAPSGVRRTAPSPAVP